VFTRTTDNLGLK
jgi:hypothetical protein